MIKKLFLLFSLLPIHQISFGQCERTVTFKCYKGRELKNGSAEQDTPIEATLSISKGKFTLVLSMNGETATAEGEIKEVSICEWTDYLQNGRAQYKADVRKDNGSAENGILEIESSNGNTKITCGSDPDTGSKLQLDVMEYTISEDEPVAPVKNEPIKKGKKGKRNN